jgi:hypothetical protein
MTGSMTRFIKISLLQRKVHAIAKLLETSAPRTCEALWNSLPLEGPAFHAKRANNEVYTLVLPFARQEPGLENGTIVPQSGDIVYFYFPSERVVSYLTGLRGVLAEDTISEASKRGLIDLAIFYDRNNLLIDYLGATPGGVFATVTEGLEEMAHACQDVWYAGAKGERLRFERLER